ncbi:MAG: hypothetical protein M3P24_02840, partial [Gemmatimonadota bacterium]|nr:hypothetical protein [Gemmatimonadota bacterium]
PAVGTAPAEELVVQNLYDEEGNLRSVSRFAVPDTNRIGTLTTAWRYDRAGRRVAELAPGSGPRTETKTKLVCENPLEPTANSCTTVPYDTTYVVEYRDSTEYDPAGNPVRWITRRGHTIEAKYDALNRLTRRIVPEVTYGVRTDTVRGMAWHFPLYRQDAEGGFSVENNGSYGLTLPADTVVLAYDTVGNLLRADNREARVRRSYYPNGALRTDTLRIRTYTGTDTTRHAYGLRLEYDRNGRRTLLEHPENLAPRDPTAVYNKGRYTYHPATGQLDTIFDVFGKRYHYTYDVQGRVERYTPPGAAAERFFYDLDGRLIRRLEGSETSPVHDDTLFYDARAKVLRARTHADSVSNAYTGLGSLAWFHVGRRYENAASEEEFTSDALGNRRLIARRELGGTTILKPSVVHEHFYEPGTGRLLRTVGALDNPNNWPDDSSRVFYDAAGNKERATAWRIVNLADELYELEERAAFYYDAEQRLRVVDRRTCIIDANGCNRKKPPHYQDRPTFEEYRYDALGRRILVRTRSEWACGNYCLNALQRFVWDGSQILYEVSAPGGTSATAAQMEQDTGFAVAYNAGFHPYGRVAYTLGQEIDRPLSVIRMEYSDTLSEPRVVYPHENWRGLFDRGSFAYEPAPQCEGVAGKTQELQDTTYTYCVEVDWPAPYLYASLEMRPQQMLGLKSWMGSLVWHQRDGTGQYYRRNRYYEPTTNRFTQEDPIGL